MTSSTSWPFEPLILAWLVLAAFAALACGTAWGQNPQTIADGITFAKSIAPTSRSQIVNPAGVNPAAWAGSTSTPTAVQPGMGAFSSPDTSTANYTAAKSMGLAAFGNQAVVNCATYDPTHGTPAQTQACAAVNFMTNQCLTPTTQQRAIMTANGTSQAPSGNCAGSYGQAQTTYGFAEGTSSTDAIFAVISGLPTNAPAQTQQVCTPQTVIVTPAQYAQEECTKNNVTNAYTCQQTLTATIVTNDTPAQTSTSCNDQGGDFGTYEVGTIGTYTGPYCFYIDIEDSCPGQTCAQMEDGTEQLISGSMIESHSHGACQSTTRCYMKPPMICPPGTTLSGSECISQTLQKHFADNCGPYTSSAGAPLPTP